MNQWQPMDFRKWPTAKRLRAVLTAVLVLLVGGLLYRTFAALLPFVLGAVLSYIMMPLVNWLDLRMRRLFRGRRVSRSLAVLIVYGFAVIVTVGALAYVIPIVVTELDFLLLRLPNLARQVYSVAPEIVQVWLDRYNSSVPQEIRRALEQNVQNTLQAVISALQLGAFKTISVLFSTVSFVLGLIIVPLWMFYVMRDEPEMEAQFYRWIPPAYREDVRSIRTLVDQVLGAYLRGQLLLNLSVGLMITIGLSLLGIDFALLLGTIAGMFEMIPVLGPFLSAIPMIIVALATAPDKWLWVAALAFLVQQVENAILVPQITHGTVKLHPALAMIVLVIGSAAAGVVGVLLSIPITAMVRDIATYLYLRLADDHPSPQEALTQVRRRA
jgi:predicted PurR-regulated permease PerM